MFDTSLLDSALEEIWSDGVSDEISEDMDLLGGTLSTFMFSFFLFVMVSSLFTKILYLLSFCSGARYLSHFRLCKGDCLLVTLNK